MREKGTRALYIIVTTQEMDLLCGNLILHHRKVDFVKKKFYVPTEELLSSIYFYMCCIYAVDVCDSGSFDYV